MAVCNFNTEGILTYTLILVLAGCCQAQLELTSNLTSSEVCPGVDVTYECTGNTTALTWSVLTVIDSVVVLEQDEIGRMRSFVNVIIILTSRNPLVTTLTIRNNNTLNESVVTCSVLGGSMTSMLYKRSRTDYFPPINFDVMESSSFSMTERVLLLQWEFYPNATRYELFCLKGECSKITLEGNVNSVDFFLDTIKEVEFVLIALAACNSRPAMLNVPLGYPPNITTLNSSIVVGLTISTSLLGLLSGGCLCVIAGFCIHLIYKKYKDAKAKEKTVHA